ncbi:MAG: hypothetical protein ACI37T_08065 [Candidatus Gastranaerophilaceae bacterium]
MNTMHHEFRHALQDRVARSSDIRIKYEWAEKCAEKSCLEKHIKPDENFKKYYEQYIEQDARFAGESIAKLFGMMA